jgi:adenine phosphoribosyltransferase
MDFYTITIGDQKKDLPIVALGPKIKVASLNLLGERKLVETISQELVPKLADIEFDYLVGPEVKVVPLLHELSKALGKDRYIVCRKQIHGYMVSPISSRMKPGLVLDGKDARDLRGKKVVVVDDVVSSGRTMRIVDDLIQIVGAQIVAHVAVFKQGDIQDEYLKNLIFLGELPVFYP